MIVVAKRKVDAMPIVLLVSDCSPGYSLEHAKVSQSRIVIEVEVAPDGSGPQIYLLINMQVAAAGSRMSRTGVYVRSRGID